jgi:hypothetical protein
MTVYTLREKILPPTDLDIASARLARAHAAVNTAEHNLSYTKRRDRAHGSQRALAMSVFHDARRELEDAITARAQARRSAAQ